MRQDTTRSWRGRVALATLAGLMMACAIQGADAAPKKPKKPKPKAPPEVAKAMNELWRRGSCLLSSVYRPAEKYAVVPGDIGDVPVLTPRVHRGRGALACYAVNGTTIWAADDQSLFRIDAAKGDTVRRYDRADGLPDSPVQDLAVADGSVWIATREGLAVLDPTQHTITDVPDVRFSLARLATNGKDAWVVSDAGAWHRPAGGAWQRLPDFPGRERLTKAVKRGFWAALWDRRVNALLPSILATDDGLYAIVSNRLLRYAPAEGQWRTITDQAWQVLQQGRAVWVLRTTGVLRYDAAWGKTTTFDAGTGPAAGRPVAMAATKDAVYLVSEPDYDPKQKAYTGGGISRFDLTAGTWTTIDTVDGTDVRFATAVLADGDDVWVAAKLYDRVVQLGAHPGMAHVKRWVPHASGLGLIRCEGGRWSLVKRQNLKTEPRWVLGQKGTLAQDKVGPDEVRSLCRSGSRVWGVYRIVPERYYAGYFISAGCLATDSDGQWSPAFDSRTRELGLDGEQPNLMLISHSHGRRIVLAEGHPIVLGLEEVAGRLWAVCQNGLFVYDPAANRFKATGVTEGFRAYWRVAAAASAVDAVWFGGDGGTVSRLDRRTGCLELVGVVRGRRVASIAIDKGKVVVRTAASKAILPVSMKSAKTLPATDTLVFDGNAWTEGKSVVRPTTTFTCPKRRNYLAKGDTRVAFLKGVFRPSVLCEDAAGNRLWLATYAGVASVPWPVDDDTE